MKCENCKYLENKTLIKGRNGIFIKGDFCKINKVPVLSDIINTFPCLLVDDEGKLTAYGKKVLIDKSL